MEKLIKLLNEHRGELLNWNIQNKPMRYHYGGYVFWLSDLTEQNCMLLIISKSYGFIKRLVDNDKIDFVKLYDSVSNYCEDLVPYPAYECLLMLLAISDTPIEDLISYLK